MLRTNRGYIEVLTSALSQRAGVKFKEGREWSVDTKKKTLYYNPLNLLNLSPLAVKGLLLHEIGHLKYTRVKKKTAIQKKYPAMQDVYNVLEDARIEKLLADEYGAFATEALGFMNYAGAKAKLAAYEHGRAPTSKYKQFTSVLNNLGLEATSRSFVPGINRTNRYQEDYILDEVKDVARGGEVYTALYKAIDATNTEELKKIADKEIYPLIKEWLEKEPDGPSPMMMPVMSRGKGPCEEDPIDNPKIPTKEELDGLLSGYIRTLTQRLGDILKERRSIRYGGAYKRGKLLSKNTYKVITDDKRLFSKRNNPHIPHYTVTMLLDGSGSMVGEVHRRTYVASHLLVRVCQKLGFKLNLIAYSNTPVVLKSIEEYRTIASGGNEDDLALDKAISLIDPKDDNLVFHMTDGGLCRSITKQLNTLKKMQATVVGIGIGTPQVRRYFSNHIVVPDVNDLSMALINLMKRIIHR